MGSRWTAALAALAGMASQMQGPCSSVNTGMFILGGQCDQYWLISATVADFGVWVAGKI